jgi:hypothetical protein
LAVTVALLLDDCSANGSSPGIAGAAPSAFPSSATPKALKKAIDECYDRPDASGDIYVRMLSPGMQWEAQELGGEWTWDYAINKCLTSVQSSIATAPTVPGSCTQVGYVDDNSGYDSNATPAEPLKNVVAQAGPAC